MPNVICHKTACLDNHHGMCGANKIVIKANGYCRSCSHEHHMMRHVDRDEARHRHEDERRLSQRKNKNKF